jgi:uncharacterized protein (TIGR03083 family)
VRIEEPPSSDIAGLFGIERERLLVTLRALDAIDWDRATNCPGWSVLGIAGHLLGNDLGVLSRQRDQHFGTSPPKGLHEKEFIAWIDELQRQWVQAARRISPRLVIDLLSWTGPQMVDLLAHQDPLERSALVEWAGPSRVPIWLNQVRELSEFWIHRQQIREALGDAADLEADLLKPILLGLRWAYPFRLDGSPAESGDTVTIAVSGSISVEWHLVKSDRGWDFQLVPERVVARLTLTTDQAWRLLTNNLSQGRQQGLTTWGDSVLLGVVLTTRAIIGEPK